ncbi:MAG: hypothetical protein LBH93_04910, partial [Chitinispirillales bacterium]|nr:hypothetical protein [Chitinispirillales bacterium]
MKKALLFFSAILIVCLTSCAAPQKSGVGAPGVGAAEGQAERVAENQPPNGGGRAADAAGQKPLPKIAVYVTGGKTADEDKAFSARITHALVSSGKYNTIERADAFLDQVAKEMAADMDGAVDDGQISRIGRQAGAGFVCIGEILEAFGASQISARILNVESVEVIASGLASGSLKTIADFAALSDRVVEQLLGVLRKADLAASAQEPDSYRTVKIGGVTWMAENLNIAAEGSWCYGNAASNCAKYGRLYTWAAAKTACPNGWHLPDTAEWKNLVDAAGGKEVAGKKLKSANGWHGDGNGTDDYGFTALPGGSYYSFGVFGDVGTFSRWWSATGLGESYAHIWFIMHYHDSGNADGNWALQYLNDVGGGLS